MYFVFTALLKIVTRSCAVLKYIIVCLYSYFYKLYLKKYMFYRDINFMIYYMFKQKSSIILSKISILLL